MKKILIVMLLAVSLSVGKLTPAKAEWPYIEVASNSPRFQYNTIMTGEVWKLIIEVISELDRDSLTFSLWEIDFDGTKTEYKRNITVDLIPDAGYYIGQYFYDWDEFDFASDPEKIHFYAIYSAGGQKLWTGAVANRSGGNDLYSENLYFNNYYYNDNHEPDFTDPASLTYKNDDFIAVHYRHSNFSAPYNNYKLVNVKEGTTEWLATDSEVYSLMGGIAQYSFFILANDFSGLYTVYDLFNDRLDEFKVDLPNGYYNLISEKLSDGTIRGRASAPLLIADDYNVFDITIPNDKVKQNSKVNLVIFKDNIINSYYDTTVSYDSVLLNDNVATFNAFVREVSGFTYNIDASMELDDIGTYYWELEPKYTMAGDSNDYTFHLSVDYSVLNVFAVEDQIQTSIFYSGFNSDLGKLLLSLVAYGLLLAVLIFYKVNTLMYTLSSLALLIVLITLNLVTGWFVTVMGVVICLGLLISVRGGNNE